jgi:hypothetical protein
MLNSHGKEFDVEDIFKDAQSTVIIGLPSFIGTLHVEMPLIAPLTMDINILEVLFSLNLGTLGILIYSIFNFFQLCLVFMFARLWLTPFYINAGFYY